MQSITRISRNTQSKSYICHHRLSGFGNSKIKHCGIPYWKHKELSYPIQSNKAGIKFITILLWSAHMTHPGCTLPNKSLTMLTHSKKDCFALSIMSIGLYYGCMRSWCSTPRATQKDLDKVVWLKIFFQFTFFFNLLLSNGRARTSSRPIKKVLVGIIFPSLIEGQLLIQITMNN